MSEVFLHGGLEKSLHEAVMVKLGLSWRVQDVEDARAVGHLLRRAANREWKQPKRKKCVAVNKGERSWRPEESFHNRQEDVEFGVCPAGFRTCLTQYFLTVLPFLPFETVVYALCYCMLGVCGLCSHTFSF